jgi:hypothetical protein
VCTRFEVVRSNRAADKTDAKAISALVEVLPDEFRDDAALYLYPYGGSTDGLDTSGVSAEAAGARLERFFQREC